jgi:flagellar hook-length control protein FliK
MILKVNPPQLGTVEVHLRVAEGTVHAQFVSPHQAVRAAIEAGLPQLQEAFVGSGLTLGQASVDAGGAGFRGQEAQPQARTAVSPVSGGVAPAEGADLLPSVGRVERSLINLFA